MSSLNGSKEKMNEDNTTNEKEQNSVLKSIASLKFISICIYAIIAQTRMNSIPAWILSWLQAGYQCTVTVYRL